jgi:hypothetical protein
MLFRVDVYAIIRCLAVLGSSRAMTCESASRDASRGEKIGDQVAKREREPIYE